MPWAAAALLAVAVRCAFVEFPVERADELTMARFKAEYADKLRPVVIRGNDRTRAEAALWSAGDFRDRCGAGEITRYVSDASSSAWGGFDMRGERRVPLASFFGEVERSNRSRDIYGFDYNLKCDCEAFVEQTTILPYFKQDVTAQAEMTGAARPGAGRGRPAPPSAVSRSCRPLVGRAMLPRSGLDARTLASGTRARRGDVASSPSRAGVARAHRGHAGHAVPAPRGQLVPAVLAHAPRRAQGLPGRRAGPLEPRARRPGRRRQGRTRERNSQLQRLISRPFSTRFG